MTFRLRLALATALAVAATVAVASAVVYVVMRNELRSERRRPAPPAVHSRSEQNPVLLHAFSDARLRPADQRPKRGPTASSLYMQVVSRRRLHRAHRRTSSSKVPVDKRDARGRTRTACGHFFTDGTVGGRSRAIYTVVRSAGHSTTGLAHGVALQFVRPTRRRRPHAPPASVDPAARLRRRPCRRRSGRRARVADGARAGPAPDRDGGADRGDGRAERARARAAAATS